MHDLHFTLPIPRSTMGRIHVLSDQVANKIAAGEVVERPASVVKELLENALDAGASSVTIDVDSGGRRLIRLADDGAGMLRDDALLAFERHATSKLATSRTCSPSPPWVFGERRCRLSHRCRGWCSKRARPTRHPACASNSPAASCCGRTRPRWPRGTTVTVRDLFYNVPARKKFLRSEQTEFAHIASLVTHYSLAHPDRSCRLRNGTNDLLKSLRAGGDLARTCVPGLRQPDSG